MAYIGIIPKDHLVKKVQKEKEKKRDEILSKISDEIILNAINNRHEYSIRGHERNELEHIKDEVEKAGYEIEDNTTYIVIRW